jgi:hypothetical protein
MPDPSHQRTDQARKGRVDVRGRASKKPRVDRHAVAAGSQGVAYDGGPVVECLFAYPVFVGNKWQTDATWKCFASALQLFYTDLFASSFGTVLRQYGYRDGVFVSAHFEPAPASGTLGDAAVAQIVADLHAGGVIPDDPAHQGNSIFAHAAFVHLDDTVAFNDTSPPPLGFSFCAPEFVYGYHWYNATLRPVPFSYGVIAGMSDACLAGDTDPLVNLAQLSRITVVASHELAELVSDPQPFTGWTPEIGDTCEGQGLNATFTGAHGTWTVQKIYSLFDDEQGQTFCVASSAAPQWSPPSAGAASAEAGPANARAADTRGLLPLPPTYRHGNRIFRKPEDVDEYSRRVTGNLPHGHIHGQIPGLLREWADVLDKADTPK